MGLSRDVVEWGVAMILMGTIGITGLSLYINATADGSLANADSTTTLIVGTVLILLAVLGIGLKFMPQELKTKIGLSCVPTQPTLNADIHYNSKPKTQQKIITALSNFEVCG